MNAERLLAHYERIADAPDAISRLRRFVLELAVHGKLVPQDSKDEPASVLLKRVAAEKARLVKAGKIRNGKGAHPDLREPPFLLPNNWTWAAFGEVHHLIRGVTYSKSDVSEVPGARFVPILRANNISTTLTHDEPVYVRQSCVSADQFLRSGDFMIALSSGSKNLVGKAAFVPKDYREAFGGFCGAIRLLDQSLQGMVRVFLQSDLYRESISEGSRGIGINNLKKETLANLFFPLPPLAEQHRIVVKVDELMALCDRLEAVRAERELIRDRLTAASLASLNAPEADTFRDDARFALDALPALTARVDQIKQLRQTILNLAVRGKLVQPEPKDEPVSELLRRIAAGKRERKKKTSDARIKIEPDPEPQSLPMVLPQGWAVQSFENLFLFIDYRGRTPPKTNEGIPLITAKNVRMGYLNREPREYISKSTFKTWMTRGFPQMGDLFFTTEAPLANICLNSIKEPFALAQRLICFQPYAEIDTKYLMFAIMSDVMQSLIDAHATGLTAKGIKAAKLKPLPIPIPPIAEQHRIVAKVDELIALCDRLEASLASADQTRRLLLEALVAEALEPAEERELEAAE